MLLLTPRRIERMHRAVLSGRIIPYLAFVWRYGCARFRESTAAVAALFRPHRFLLYLAPLLAVAFAEEWGWDRLVWHEQVGAGAPFEHRLQQSEALGP